MLLSRAFCDRINEFWQHSVYDCFYGNDSSVGGDPTIPRVEVSKIQCLRTPRYAESWASLQAVLGSLNIIAYF